MVRQSKSHFDKTVKDGKYPPKHTELEDKAGVYDYKVCFDLSLIIYKIYNRVDLPLKASNN